MPDAADLAVFHFLRWALFRWLFVSEVLEVVVLRHISHLFVFASRLIQFIHAVVKPFAIVYLLILAFFLLGDFRCVDLGGQVWLLSGCLRIATCLCEGDGP